MQSSSSSPTSVPFIPTGFDRRDQPSLWVTRHSEMIRPGGRVLDLACGRGRHTRWLTRRGFQLTAVDADTQAIAELAGLRNVDALCADLESGGWPLPGQRFDAVVITNYLYRPLMRHVAHALDAGGLVIYETFMQGNERFGRPRSPEYLLAPGELLEWSVSEGLELVAFEEGETSIPRPAVVQRLCARRPSRH
ncbi:class I SAM-dependent methyltransferase [Niveibacterium sp. SC-1]|uniref:class I SAM-dependent methyltransferase n=1 Tax=Niveibacterium sp. SC-1 TaxID=3135646 RepID=UPI00311E9797